MKFEELNLHNKTLQIIGNTKQDKANAFQESVLKAINDDRNLILNTGENNEGSDAVALAALDQEERSSGQEGTRTLVLVSDSQNLEAIQKYASRLKSDNDSITIGESGDEEAQSNSIEESHKTIFADPARLYTLLRKNRYIFRDLELIAFIGFDEMISAGLESTLANIKKRILCKCSSVIVTDTYKGQVKHAALNLVNNPMVKGFGPPPPPSISSSLTQNYIKVPPRMKISTLLAFLNDNKDGNSIIFTDSKRGTDKLYRIFRKQHMKAVSLHYKLSEERKAQRFADFTNGNAQYLLVSDISAAQFDLNNVTRVVNYDVPGNADEYRYRAGLVGSQKGSQIVSLVSKQDQSDISKLQNILGEAPVEIPLPEKARQKLKERKQKKKGSRRNGRNNKNKEEDLTLPKPSYDQLDGGRNGNYKKEENGIVTFFKKLFS